MSETVLVLGEMPEGADPQTFLAAGPWCFAGREHLFPGWEKEFSFPPEPLVNPEALPAAARRAQALCVRAMPAIAACLSDAWQQFPSVYWQTLLAPWAIKVASQIVERELRVRAMLRHWGNIQLQIPLAPENAEFNFRDEQDFALRGSLGCAFNTWIFSRLLRRQLPPGWQAAPMALAGLRQPDTVKASLASRCKELARRALLRLPFPPLKGMTLGQAWAFSRAVAHSCHTADHSLDLERAFADQEELPDYMPVFLAALPRSLKKLKHNPKKCRPAAPRLRVASISAYELAAYRQELALWRARGNRLAYVQHGGNYGQIRVACDAALVEYSQDVFFTWGWTSQENCAGNFIPMPSPLLCPIRKAWRSGGEHLIFIGAEMAAYAYRLESRPTPMQYLAYRDAKRQFLAHLPDAIIPKTLYRPYFPLPGTLSDAPWLLERFPELGLCRGALLPHLLRARLLVLDHHGTTMLEALAADAPMLMYWNPLHWPLCKEAAALLKKLEGAGVWHASPLAAAAKARDIWPDPLMWWQSPPVREAVGEFCRYQARTSAEMNSIWTNTLKKL